MKRGGRRESILETASGWTELKRVNKDGVPGGSPSFSYALLFTEKGKAAQSTELGAAFAGVGGGLVGYCSMGSSASRESSRGPMNTPIFGRPISSGVPTMSEPTEKMERSSGETKVSTLQISDVSP